LLINVKIKNLEGLWLTPLREVIIDISNLTKEEIQIIQKLQYGEIEKVLEVADNDSEEDTSEEAE
jgi:hypothetical protein